jgi:hypothetical protein
MQVLSPEDPIKNEKPREIVWNCTITTGLAVGSTRRYSGKCNLDGLDGVIEPIRIDGISSSDQVFESAANQIARKLETK